VLKVATICSCPQTRSGAVTVTDHCSC